MVVLVTVLEVRSIESHYRLGRSVMSKRRVAVGQSAGPASRGMSRADSRHPHSERNR